MILSSAHTLAVVDGVLSGLHAPGESHFELLSAFASAPQLEAAFRHAQSRGLQNHEMGDAILLVPNLLQENLASLPRGMRSILFCHGLESTPHGAKYQALVGAGLSVEAPDFQGQALAERVDTLVQLLAEREEPPLLIGSSYGGLTALCAAILHAEGGNSLSELILCAPALARGEEPASSMQLHAPAQVTIIHGRRDEVIPLEISERWIASNPGARLIAVDDDHRLGQSLGLIVREAQRAARLSV